MKAIILAGGKGERLRPFTNNRPKGMVKVEGKPILEYQINWLVQYGVTEIIFACGYKYEVIKEYFEDGKKSSLKISYSVEENPLGRGGGVKKAWEKIKNNEPIIVTNGDIYTDMDLERAIQAHKEQNKKHGTIATICLFPYKSPYGIVRFGENGIVESFEEKRALPFWVNGGIYIFEHEVKDYLPVTGDHETTTFQELAAKNLIYAYKSIDYWKGIDTVKDLNEFIYEKKALSTSQI